MATLEMAAILLFELIVSPAYATAYISSANSKY